MLLIVAIALLLDNMLLTVVGECLETYVFTNLDKFFDPSSIILP